MLCSFAAIIVNILVIFADNTSGKKSKHLKDTNETRSPSSCTNRLIGGCLSYLILECISSKIMSITTSQHLFSTLFHTVISF